MAETEAFREFKAGLRLLQENQADGALQHIVKAASLEKNNPYYMSYLGVAIGKCEGKWRLAAKLCDTAVRMKRNQPQLYLNLAEVYRGGGRPEDAAETLKAGLKYARRDVRLVVAFDKLRRRRPPVFRFLEREHPLNRQFGKLRHRALQVLRSSH
jgi:predicted Zn-dependent protease